MDKLRALKAPARLRVALALVLLALCLLVSLAPVVLLRREAGAGQAPAALSIAPGVIANGAIAYALRLGILVPFFALGSAGDFWPVLVAGASFAAGVLLVVALRRPIFAFLGEARSSTVRGFVAGALGGRLAPAAAGVTALALLGLFGVESRALVDIVAPAVEGRVGAFALLAAVLLGGLVCASLADRAGANQAMQLQLGLLYLGLFGSAALLLYLAVSAVTRMPAAAGFAVGFLGLFAALFLPYRRLKFVDPAALKPKEQSALSRGIARFGRILNRTITWIIALVIAVAVVQVYASGLSALARDAVAVLGAHSALPGLTLAALALIAFLYPLADVATWQRLALWRAAQDPETKRSALARAVVLSAIEPGLIWLFVALLGAVAGALVQAPGGTPWGSLIPALTAQQNAVASTAIFFVLLAVFAAALAGATGLFSALLDTLQEDLVRSGDGRRPARGAVALAALLVAAACLAFAAVEVSETGAATWLLACLGLQVLLAPLVLVVASRRRQPDQP